MKENRTNTLEYISTSTIAKWGHSQGIRIPKMVADMLDLKINDNVEIKVVNDTINIRKKSTKKYNSLRERVEAYYQCSLDEIKPIDAQEVDWGLPKGNEVW